MNRCGLRSPVFTISTAESTIFGSSTCPTYGSDQLTPQARSISARMKIAARGAKRAT
jgi:hypothetical protein